MQTRHLKTRIAFSLLLFIGLGMVSIDLVFGLLFYRQVVKSEVVQARATLVAMTHYLQAAPLLSPENIRYFSDMSQVTGLGIAVVASDGSLVFQARVDGDVAGALIDFTTDTCGGAGEAKLFYDGSFGLLGLRYKHIFLAIPLRSVEGEVLGSVGLDVHLHGFFQLIWKGQKFVLLYILFNLLVLSALAYLRFSRFLIMPLRQLAEKAASYQDDDLRLTSDFRSDDVSTLSRSLNQMFRRIHNDRHELQKMVTALEEANVSLSKAQADVVRAEKMASVGRLSAGIAHEIGNPLGIVLGYLELLKDEGLSDEERVDFITRAMAEIQRINTIIRQLLDLARPIDDDCGSSSVHGVLDGFKDDLALQSVVGEMGLSFDLQAEEDRVEIDPEKLRQVFLNLLLNGADALQDMDRPGEMVIRTGVISYQQGKGLEIRFVDNGPGIDPAHMQYIFDPFFTTKEVGHGTGLGLSVSYMIIENGGGTIQALGVEGGRGTEFRIVLPLVHEG